MMDAPGTIYLLHFDQPFKHAAHYLGWTSLPVEERLARHDGENGARLLAALKRAGIGYKVAMTKEGTRTEERRLKNLGSAKRWCPICRSGV